MQAFQTPVPVPAWRRVLASRTNILWIGQLRISALLVLSIIIVLVHVFYVYCYSESEKLHDDRRPDNFFLFPEDKKTDTTYTVDRSQAKVDTGGTETY